MNDEFGENLRRHGEIIDMLGAAEVRTPEELDALLDKLSAERGAIPTIPLEYSELYDRKWNEAVATARKLVAARMESDARLRSCLSELDALVAAGEFATKEELDRLDAKWRSLTPSPEADADYAGRSSELRSRFEAEAVAAKVADERVGALAAKLEELLAAGDMMALKEAKSAADVECRSLSGAGKEAVKRYGAVARKASNAIAMYFDTLDQNRWASYTVKLDILAELEKLSAGPRDNMREVAKKLNALRDKWHKLGAVPREKSEEISARYAKAVGTLPNEVDSFFAKLRAEREAATTEKTAMCEQAESLAASTDWKATGDFLKELQSKWKSLPNCGKPEAELYSRFRKACNTFFEARGAVYEERKREFTAATEVIEKMIAEAEALQPGDLQSARALRERFSAAPRVGRAWPELRDRFNAAMDRFFCTMREEAARRADETAKLVAELGTLAKDAIASAARADEIRTRLSELHVGRLPGDAWHALERFDRALDVARSAERCRLAADEQRVSEQLIDMYASGGTYQAPSGLELLNGAKRLATLVESAMSGDEQSKRKLDRRIAASVESAESALSGLEEILSGMPSGDDLAAQLAAAMQGGASYKAKDGRVGELAEAFRNAGAMPMEKRTVLSERFSKVMADLKEAGLA
ncbi:MAG: DUF349 domain-containing protein [Victivallaceae bacterium]|nr:DUF349 domain-containing protein [Victivallaceae bacterium]